MANWIETVAGKSPIVISTRSAETSRHDGKAADGGGWPARPIDRDRLASSIRSRRLAAEDAERTSPDAAIKAFADGRSRSWADRR
jgi:hypothetical protein